MSVPPGRSYGDFSKLREARQGLMDRDERMKEIREQREREAAEAKKTDPKPVTALELAAQLGITALDPSAETAAIVAKTGDPTSRTSQFSRTNQQNRAQAVPETVKPDKP